MLDEHGRGAAATGEWRAEDAPLPFRPAGRLHPPRAPRAAAGAETNGAGYTSQSGLIPPPSCPVYGDGSAKTGSHELKHQLECCMTPKQEHEIKEQEKRIKEGNWFELFTRGGCGHFVRLLHSKHKYPIRGASYNDCRLAHVWCRLPDGTSMDIRGRIPELELIDSLGDGAPFPPPDPFDVTTKEVEDMIQAKNYPPDLIEKIGRVAEQIDKAMCAFYKEDMGKRTWCEHLASLSVTL